MSAEPLAKEDKLTLFDQHCDNNDLSNAFDCFKRLIASDISKTKITKAVKRFKQLAQKQENAEILGYLVPLYEIGVLKGRLNLIDVDVNEAQRLAKKASQFGHAPSTLNCALSTKNASKKPHLLSLAMQQSEHNDETYNEAKECLQQGAKENPNAVGHLFLALANRESTIQEAIDCMQEGIEAFPDKLLSSLQQPTIDEVNVYERLVELSKTNAAALYTLGFLHTKYAFAHPDNLRVVRNNLVEGERCVTECMQRGYNPDDYKVFLKDVRKGLLKRFVWDDELAQACEYLLKLADDDDTDELYRTVSFDLFELLGDSMQQEDNSETLKIGMQMLQTMGSRNATAACYFAKTYLQKPEWLENLDITKDQVITCLHMQRTNESINESLSVRSFLKQLEVTVSDPIEGWQEVLRTALSGNNSSSEKSPKEKAEAQYAVGLSRYYDGEDCNSVFTNINEQDFPKIKPWMMLQKQELTPDDIRECARILVGSIDRPLAFDETMSVIMLRNRMKKLHNEDNSEATMVTLFQHDKGNIEATVALVQHDLAMYKAKKRRKNLTGAADLFNDILENIRQNQTYADGMEATLAQFYCEFEQYISANPNILSDLASLLYLEVEYHKSFRGEVFNASDNLQKAEIFLRKLLLRNNISEDLMLVANEQLFNILCLKIVFNCPEMSDDQKLEQVKELVALNPLQPELYKKLSLLNNCVSAPNMKKRLVAIFEGAARQGNRGLQQTFETLYSIGSENLVGGSVIQKDTAKAISFLRLLVHNNSSESTFRLVKFILAKTLIEKADHNLAEESLLTLVKGNDEIIAQRACWYLYELYTMHDEKTKAEAYASDYVKDRLQLKQNVCEFIQKAEELCIETELSENFSFLEKGMDEIEKLGQNGIEDHRYYLVGQLEKITTLFKWLELQVQNSVNVQCECDQFKRSLLWGRKTVLADKISGVDPKGAFDDFKKAQNSKDLAVVEEACWRAANLYLQINDIQKAVLCVLKAIKLEKEPSPHLLSCIGAVYERVQTCIVPESKKEKFSGLKTLFDNALEEKGLLSNIQTVVNQIIHQEECDSLD